MTAAARWTLCLGVLAIAAPAAAQSSTRTASDQYLDNIRASATNVPSVNRVLSDNFYGSRAQASGNGISNFMVTNNAPVSSGFSRSTASAGVATLPGVGSGAKPFENLDRGSAISPYLNLFNTGISGGSATIDNYNVLVRPQLQQQRVNRQLELQTQKLNQRVQSISAQPAMQPQGSEQIMRTGHQTTFGYYSRFYPGLNQRRR